MERRRFLQLSGISFAALALPCPDAGEHSPFDELKLPDEVFRWQDGRWQTIPGTVDGWLLEETSVQLKKTAAGYSVTLRSPVSALEKIKLSWKLSFAADAAFLGDDWERSYGTLAWDRRPGLRAYPWYLLINSGGKQAGTRGFGVRTGAGALCSWQVNAGRLELVLDTRSGSMGVMAGDRAIEACEYITAESLPGETAYTFDGRFCGLMCPEKRLPSKPVYGVNDWYYAYGNNSRELINRLTGLMAGLCENSDNLPFSVVDDGWSLKAAKESTCCRGDDYKRVNDKFGDMSLMAADIRKQGMRPGLWTRPLLANPSDEHGALIPVRGGEEKNNDRFLDPTVPENLHRVAETIALYKTWGFDMVKHDYSSYDMFGRWGIEMRRSDITAGGWHFRDRSKTNAEIILGLYRTIREAAGEMYLIGCNTFSHLSAGLFELNRTGDDTSGREWDRTRRMGVNTLAFRLPQHNHFYAADGDCVGLTTSIPWSKNKQWLQLLSESSAPLFISPQPEAMGAEQKAAVKKAFALASRVQPLAEPLDWMSDSFPVKWKLNRRKVSFDWS